MIVYFVGMHNKVGMTALDSRTKTGKVIDSVIEKFKDVSDVQFVKTNLCDTDYLPKETALHAGQWHAKFKPTENDVVVTLGRWVKDNFHYSGQRVINAKHPASIFGVNNTELYIKELYDKIIAIKMTEKNQFKPYWIICVNTYEHDGITYYKGKMELYYSTRPVVSDNWRKATDLEVNEFKKAHNLP